MRKPVFSFVFAGAFLVAGSALALNPQPLPPGKAAPNHAYEPPDPCMQAQMQSHGSGGGAGKIRMSETNGGHMMMMRKAGGEQMGTKPHCLNPQPLPPG
jgi:hypothetical protein